VFTVIGGGVNHVLGPPSSIIADNNHLATALLVSMPLMNYLRMESRHAIIRYGLLATMTLTLFSVVGSYSRGALLALAAVSGYFWLKSSSKLLSGMLVALALVTAITFMPEGWIARMHSIQEYQMDASATDRLVAWHVSWLMALARPLVGGGFTAPYHEYIVSKFLPGGQGMAVHSIWFEVLGEHGFPTFFVWVGINVAAAVYARRIVRLATGVPGLEWCVNLAKMAQVSMVAYIVGGSFLSLCYWDYYFTILVAVGAVYQHVTATLGSAAKTRLAVSAMPPQLALPQRS
jgi:putative inorganic carbon (HCO3(-)) transporter